MAKLFQKPHIKGALFTAAVLALLLVSVGGVRAWLTARTQRTENTLVPPTVTCAVEESFDGSLKKDVRIRNTGTIDAYIRAVVVVTFVDAEGKVSPQAPVEGTDYTLIWGSGWQRGSDGFWYYPDPVVPDGLTANLIDRVSSLSAPEGFSLNVQIIATAIQSTPASAAEDAWGVTVTDGKMAPQ